MPPPFSPIYPLISSSPITMCSTVTHEVFIHPAEGKAFTKVELADMQKGLARNCYRWAMFKAALPLDHPRYTDLDCLCTFFTFTTRKTKVQVLRQIRASTTRELVLNHAFVRVSQTPSLAKWLESWDNFIKEGPWYGDDDVFAYNVDYADSEDDNKTEDTMPEDDDPDQTDFIDSDPEEEKSDN